MTPDAVVENSKYSCTPKRSLSLAKVEQEDVTRIFVIAAV